MATPESPEVSHIITCAFVPTTRDMFKIFNFHIFVNDTTEADDEEQEDNCKHNHI